MIDVIYPGPLSAVYLPDGTLCEKGSPVTVDDATGVNLITQGFKKAPVKKVEN